MQDPDTFGPNLAITIGRDCWLFFGNIVYHDGNKQTLGIFTSSLKKGDSVGCCLTGGGDLEIYINGQKRAVGWRNVPVDKPLWGVVDICGRARTIQSEFYCGKLYSYNVYSVLYTYICECACMYYYQNVVSTYLLKACHPPVTFCHVTFILIRTCA